MSVLDTFSLSGQVSVVTGANRGIGRALATALAEAGSDVVLLVRDLEACGAKLSTRAAASALPPRVAGADHLRRCGGRSRRSWTGSARSTSWSTTPEPASTARRWR